MGGLEAKRNVNRNETKREKLEEEKKNREGAAGAEEQIKLGGE